MDGDRVDGEWMRRERVDEKRERVDGDRVDEERERVEYVCMQV